MSPQDDKAVGIPHAARLGAEKKVVISTVPELSIPVHNTYSQSQDVSALDAIYEIDATVDARESIVAVGPGDAMQTL